MKFLDMGSGLSAFFDSLVNVKQTEVAYLSQKLVTELRINVSSVRSSFFTYKIGVAKIVILAG